MRLLENKTSVSIGLVVLLITGAVVLERRLTTAEVGGDATLERRLTKVELEAATNSKVLQEQRQQETVLVAKINAIQIDVAVIKAQVERLVKEAEHDRRRGSAVAGQASGPITFNEVPVQVTDPRAAAVAGAREVRATERTN